MYNEEEEIQEAINVMVLTLEKATESDRIAKALAKQSKLIYEAMKSQHFSHEDAIQLTIANLRAGKQ